MITCLDGCQAKNETVLGHLHLVQLLLMNEKKLLLTVGCRLQFKKR